MESSNVVKFGIFDDFSHVFGDDTITNIMNINFHELLVSTKNNIYILDNNVVKMKYPIKLSTCTIIPDTNFLIGVSIKKGELMIYQVNGLTQNYQSSGNPPLLLKKFATNQPNIFHILYSPKSQSIITFGSEVKVFNFQYKLGPKSKSKITITITNHSSFPLNYDSTNMIPPQFDERTESILLPTENGIYAYNLDGNKVSQCSKYPTTIKTVYSFNPQKNASKPTSKTKKKESLIVAKNTLTYDSETGMNLWGIKGQIIKQFDTIRSAVLSIIFVDDENSICLNSCHILFFLNIKTGKTFYYMNLNKNPSRLFLVSLYNEPVLCACFGSNLRALSLVIPWHVWQLNIDNTLSINRCNKYLSAARILINVENSFMKFFSPRNADQIALQTQHDSNHPLSYLYDRGTVEKYVFDKKRKFYNVEVSKINHSKNDEVIRDSLFVIQQNGTIKFFDTNVSSTQKVVNVSCKAIQMTICRIIQKVDESEVNYRWCFAVASEKGELFVIDYFTFEEVCHFFVSNETLIQLSFNFEYNLIVMIFEKEAALVDIENEKIADSIQITPFRVASSFADLLLFGYDSGHVQRAKIEDRHLALCDDRKKSEVKKSSKEKNDSTMLKPHSCPITSFSFSPKIWVSSGLDGNVIAWSYGMEIITKISLPLPLRACLIMNARRDILVATATEIMKIKNDCLISNLKDEEENENEHGNEHGNVSKSENANEEGSKNANLNSSENNNILNDDGFDNEEFEDPEIKEIDNFDKMRDASFLRNVKRRPAVGSVQSSQKDLPNENENENEKENCEDDAKDVKNARKMKLMKKNAAKNAGKSDTSQKVTKQPKGADENKKNDSAKELKEKASSQPNSNDSKKSETSTNSDGKSKENSKENDKETHKINTDLNSPSKAKSTEINETNEKNSENDSKEGKINDDTNEKKLKESINSKSGIQNNDELTEDKNDKNLDDTGQFTIQKQSELEADGSEFPNSEQGQDTTGSTEADSSGNSSSVLDSASDSNSNSSSEAPSTGFNGELDTNKLDDNDQSKAALNNESEEVSNDDSEKVASNGSSKLDNQFHESESDNSSFSCDNGAEKSSETGDVSASMDGGTGSGVQSNEKDRNSIEDKDGANNASDDGSSSSDKEGIIIISGDESEESNDSNQNEANKENKNEANIETENKTNKDDENEANKENENEANKDAENEFINDQISTENSEESKALYSTDKTSVQNGNDDNSSKDKNDPTETETEAVTAIQEPLAKDDDQQFQILLEEEEEENEQQESREAPANEEDDVQDAAHQEEADSFMAAKSDNKIELDEPEQCGSLHCNNERSPTPPPIRPTLSIPSLCSYSDSDGNRHSSRRQRSRTPSPKRSRRRYDTGFKIPPNIIIDKEAVLALYGRGRLEFKPFVDQIQKEFYLSHYNDNDDDDTNGFYYHNVRHITLNYVRKITKAKQERKVTMKSEVINSNQNGFYSISKVSNYRNIAMTPQRKPFLPPISLNRSFSPTAYVYNYENNTETFFNSLDIHSGVTTPRRLISLSARKPLLLTQPKNAMIVRPNINSKKKFAFSPRKSSPSYQTGGRSPRRKLRGSDNDNMKEINRNSQNEIEDS